MILDQREREEALDPSRSFIVQAPAGSGKTGLLVQRYLRLLSLVERPESVVAMTFTRKAAGEMKDRVLDALLAAQQQIAPGHPFEESLQGLASAVLTRDRQQGWNLLLDSSRLQIQTIDSLCAMLTRQMPVMSGFGGVAQVVENADEFYRAAARNTLRTLAEGTEEDRALLTRLGVYFDSDFAGLQDQIVRMLAQRDQWRFSDCDRQGETADFCELLARASGALVQVFRQHGTVDFTAITRAAIDVLGTPEQPTDLLYRLDYKILHLLVDEFQDTSLAQYELVEALTAQWSEGDGHTLFLVGDPMQSIYGFRGAEVSLFLRSWSEGRLNSVRLHRLALKTNFRSTPEILEWVQRKFEPIMPDDAEGGVRFRSSQAAREASGEAPALIPLIEDKGAEEATEIVTIARAARGNGTVAVLVRSRNHLASILPILRREAIPYEAVEIDSLSGQQHVIDLVSLTRAVLHVGDRISWLACLRAPWCGLTLSDLSALAENERERPILDLLSDPDKIAKLSVEGRWRAVRAQEILSAAVARAGRVPLRTLIEDVWLLLGGPAILDNAYQKEDIETYFQLLESLEEGGIIRDFSLLSERLACLFARPAEGENYLQVMTVHQAKGLEFDTVIIPHLEGRARSSDRDLLAWNEEIAEDGTASMSVAVQPRKGEKNSSYDAIQEIRQRKENHELKRLFYVACTRAKNSLHLLGNVTRKKGGSEISRPPSNSFLGQIWTEVEAEFKGVVRRSPAQGRLFEEPPTARSILRSLPLSWQPPKLARPVKWQPEWNETTASARKVTYEWVSDTGRHVGTVVHGLIKRAIESQNIAGFEARLSALSPIVESELRRLGVSAADQETATERVMRALTNTLHSERGRWILSRHAQGRAEWPIGGRIGDTLISGTIDRSFRDESGRFWIIDYKTSEHQGGQLTQFLDEQQRRYRSQLENYAALLAKEVPIWLGLYFPLLDAWREWQFEVTAVPAGHYTGE